MGDEPVARNQDHALVVDKELPDCPLKAVHVFLHRAEKHLVVLEVLLLFVLLPTFYSQAGKDSRDCPQVRCPLLCSVAGLPSPSAPCRCKIAHFCQDCIWNVGRESRFDEWVELNRLGLASWYRFGDRPELDVPRWQDGALTVVHYHSPALVGKDDISWMALVFRRSDLSQRRASDEKLPPALDPTDVERSCLAVPDRDLYREHAVRDLIAIELGLELDSALRRAQRREGPRVWFCVSFRLIAGSLGSSFARHGRTCAILLPDRHESISCKLEDVTAVLSDNGDLLGKVRVEHGTELLNPHGPLGSKFGGQRSETRN